MKFTFDRYWRVKRLLDLVGFIANGCGAMLTIVYFNLLPQYSEIQAQAPSEPGHTDDMLLPILITVGLLLLGWGYGQLRLRPLWIWHRRITRQKDSEATPLSVQRLALNLPIITAVITLIMWIVAGFTLSISDIGLFTGQPDWSEFWQDWLEISAIPGTVTCILVFFANERVWRSEVPLFFPNGDLSSTPAFRMTLRRRLLILFVMGTVPLLILAVATYNQASQMVRSLQPSALLPALLRVELFLVGLGLLMAVTLAFTLGASLVEPVEALGRQMATVREGGLEAQVAVTSNDELGGLATGFNAMVSGLRREEVIRRLFGLYVTPQVADYAIQHGVELGGQLIEATVMFTDIRSFTAMAEKMSPEAVIALLNRYFQTISTIVVERGGLVNKFGGDSLLAVFGTPLNPARDHAQQAVQAAQALLQALEDFNQDQIRRGEPTLRIGIGVATGPVLAGNVGSEERLEYTVIGDTVNLASRLDTMSKEVNATILLNETTALAVEEWAPLQQVGQLSVRGKEEPVQVYTLQLPSPEDTVGAEKMVL